MSAGLTGMLLGLGVAVGLVLVLRYAPPFRSVRLVDRLAPYVHDTPPPSRLLGTATEPGLLTAVRRVFGPAVGDGARLVDRMLGGRAAVRRRLDALATDTTVEDFRVEQVIWGGLGLAAAALVTTVGSVAAGSLNVLSGALLCVAGLVGGILGRDWWLTQQVQKREELLLAEFPVVAELLALAVTAGESPTAAIARVTRLSGGELARELGRPSVAPGPGCPSSTRCSRWPTAPPSTRWPGSSTACSSPSSAARRSPRCCAPRRPTSGRPASAGCSRPGGARRSG